MKGLDPQPLVGSDSVQILQACSLMFQQGQGTIKVGTGFDVGKDCLGGLTGLQSIPGRSSWLLGTFKVPG